MFWDKKKTQDGLPDLPVSSRPTIPEKRLPELPVMVKRPEMHQLPSFPDSPMQRGFSQSAIRSAISNDVEEADEEIKPEPKEERGYALEMNEWAPSQVPPKRIIESKPVYVRLDKFQAAKKTLDEVRSMLSESEGMLKKIRDVKMKEEQELSAWEKEMQVLRARINHVSSDIFERME